MKRTNQLMRLIALAIVASFTLSAYAQQPDFSGHWQLNKTKTDFGQAPEFVLSRALGVSKSDGGISVDRTNLTSAMEEKHYTEKIRLDGTTTQTLTISGNMESDSLKAGTVPGFALGITIKSPANAPIMNVTETWTLEDGGKTLVVDKQVEQPGGTKYEIKGYYDKQ